MIPVMQPWLGDEEARAAAEAVASGWVAQGPRVAAFEEAVAGRVGAAHGVALSSCTTALHLSLLLLGAGPGDEVVVPSLSFIATANAARYVGATPVFADVEPDTLNLSADTIKQALSPRTRAVILVHQGGMPADVDAVHALCDPLGVAVVEDAACAIGSTYRGRPIGAGSDLVAFSFHPRKVITTGEGGMLTTPRDEWAERLRRLREHGMNVSAAARHAARSPVIERYLETGYNYRMTDILAGVPGIVLPHDPPHGTTNFQSFWIVLGDDFPTGRDRLLERLRDQGISARRGIMAAHLEPAFAELPPVELPTTDRLTRRSLILPLFHAMTEEQQDRVVAAVRDAAAAPDRRTTPSAEQGPS